MMVARCGDGASSGQERIDKTGDPAEVPLNTRDNDTTICLGDRGNDHIKRATRLDTKVLPEFTDRILPIETAVARA